MAATVVSLDAKLKRHPLAAIFPEIEGDEFSELVADIKANGQLDPIGIWQGKVLDGWNRYRACLEAGIQNPRVQPLHFDDDAAAVGYVVGKNLRRRHLSPGKLAEIAVKIWKSNRLSQPKVAAAIGVSVNTIKRANKAAGTSKRSKGGGRRAVAASPVDNTASQPCTCGPDRTGPCETPRPDCRHMPIGPPPSPPPSNDRAKSDAASPPLTSSMIDFDNVPAGQLRALAKDLVAYLLENDRAAAQHFADALYRDATIIPVGLEPWADTRDTARAVDTQAEENKALRAKVIELETALNNESAINSAQRAPAATPEAAFEAYLAWKDADQLSFARMIGEHGRDPRKFSEQARADWIRIKQLSILSIYNPLGAEDRAKIFRLIRNSPPNNVPENERARHADGEVTLPPDSVDHGAQHKVQSPKADQPPKLPEDYRRMTQPGELLDKKAQGRRLNGRGSVASRNGDGFE